MSLPKGNGMIAGNNHPAKTRTKSHTHYIPIAHSGSNTDPVDILLRRLKCVQQRRENQWEALCPCHPDKSPSLRIGRGEDGRALVHCQAGCKPQDVVASVGLTMGDLFTRSTRSYGKQSRIGYLSPFERSHELDIIRIVECDLKKGKKLNDLDAARYEVAIRKTKEYEDNKWTR